MTATLCLPTACCSVCGAPMPPSRRNDVCNAAMSIVAELEMRIAALEAERVTLTLLKTHNAERMDDAEHRREAIRQILETDPGPRRGAAKRVLRALVDTDFADLTLRCVQHHITQLRKSAALHDERLAHGLRSCRL